MDILTSKENGILTIAIDRLDKKNALTAAMYQTMVDAIKDAEADASVRVIMFVGKPQIFCAGNDIEDFLKNPPNSPASPVFQFLWQISHASKPLVAAVSGAAVGIGTTMLLHFDLVYAADNARFSMPFTQLGLCPEAASSLLFPQLAGYQRGAEKLLLGEAFDVNEALAMGLVNKILPAEELLAFAQAQAAKLVALPAASIRITKQLMKGTQTAAVEAKMTQEISHFGEMLKAPEAKEAFTAFFEKRRPNFGQFN
ncbi:enoyl-CoA hydratase [Glaciimonas immobilis]|uniref:Enoyl-CoA hydratase/carnithine racemase n=1 Tax=Glaciimonas immobilis TaxID=728004 RepID=A0A840RT49_9BURK|nr:enoyl-CoA hydratase [Glaciimonas immobilis]KAF3999751.1 enoyl-CoA hydratase [Glaciimonas immobilis]MBB5200208.1 enoyl-CoA hydratase/carnithine racemase [Glaciimonas immobilis]